MTKQLFLSIFTLILTYNLCAQPCKEVVGYYPGWQWYDRSQLVKPTSIDYSQYTIIQYAFLNMDADGNLNVTDPWGDKNILLGNINWAVAPAGYDSSYDLGNSDYHIPNTNLDSYAHNNGVKLLVSLGGWTLSSLFPAIAADPAKRQNFAENCALICQLYDLDGVDIDWEYPGYAVHNGTPADKVNFTLLLQEIRNELDALEFTLGRELLISAAIGAAPEHQANYEWENLSVLLDMFNVMTYDYYGTWDTQLNHNAPLYFSGPGNPDFSCDASIQRLLNEYNVSPDKINIGMPFYGRSQLSNQQPSLFGTGNGNPDFAHFSIDAGPPLYYNILLQSNEFIEYWDIVANVPYLIGINSNSFVSFDNVESISKKAEYAVNYNLRGCIIWEITGDYIETFPGSGIIATTPLASAINDVFCNYKSGGDIYGCTIPEADNYNPLATINDGSCIVPGCIYEAAINFNPQATIDNASCIFECDNNCPFDGNNDGLINSSDLLGFLAV
jgi:chitinase